MALQTLLERHARWRNFVLCVLPAGGQAMTDHYPPRRLPAWLREEVNRELDKQHQKAINYGRHWWQRERRWPRP